VNDRGEYGRIDGWPYQPRYEAPPLAFVGQGSIFPHTPGDVENELDQLHGEIMCFAQELIELKKTEEDQANAAVQKERNDELAAWKVVESFRPLVSEAERLEKLLTAAGIDKKTAERWRLEVNAPYAEIVMSPLGGVKARDVKRLFVAALTALDKFMPKVQRVAAVNRARELSQKAQDVEYKVRGQFPLVQWDRSTWTPFFASWSKFHGEKKDIPLQTWPLSGTWDRIQDYRTQFINLYNKAPFKSNCPKPLDPRKDPSLTGGLEEIGKIVRYAAYGGLVLGGVFVVAKIIEATRSGRR